MAQHHLIKEENEPKLFKELRQIIPVVNHRWHNLKESMRINILGKTVVRLPVDFNPNGRAIGIGDFNLEDSSWDQSANGFSNLQLNAYIEVHFNKSGDIQNVYYPV